MYLDTVDFPAPISFFIWVVVLAIAVIVAVMVMHAYPMSTTINSTHAMMVANP